MVKIGQHRIQHVARLRALKYQCLFPSFNEFWGPLFELPFGSSFLGGFYLQHGYCTGA
uniref:Uncharacterized protein MANES_08G020900 n=1 Tax=Rhizophora mucronata TaxID=61149 RepID=A0A2P2JD65_RHIMU